MVQQYRECPNHYCKYCCFVTQVPKITNTVTARWTSRVEEEAGEDLLISSLNILKTIYPERIATMMKGPTSPITAFSAQVWLESRAATESEEAILEQQCNESHGNFAS
jgi:hypothetical protein